MPAAKIARKVIIVEDEGLVALLLEDMLTGLGYEVVAVAGRLGQAEQVISESPVEIVILDVNLDGEQTYSLARMLSSRGIPFIFATGYGASGLKDEWKSVPTLQKPFRAGDIERAMRQALGSQTM